MCDWNMCRFNSNKDPDSGDPGECQFDGTVELKDTNEEKVENKLECAQFKWMEAERIEQEAEQVEGKSI
jgi:hypothetical protein